jgi:protein-S-isoprenylcysteine O-methyltransferase Ste14
MYAATWSIIQVNQMTAKPGSKPDGRIRSAFAIVGTAIFLLLAPGIVAGLVPWWISGWRVHAAFWGFTPFRVIGVLLIASVIPVLLESFGRFALQGIGTPAPGFPTRHLVVKGFYRYVRNPMYLAVVSLILGQALLLGDIHILAYATLAWLVMHLFVRTYEEPTLRKSFGAEYEIFCAHVPRWIPHFHSVACGHPHRDRPPPIAVALSDRKIAQQELVIM